MTNTRSASLSLPILPFIREANFAIRTPWHVPARRLLDYLLIYIQEGECIIAVNGQSETFVTGDFCLIQPHDLLTLAGMTNTITPYAHLDVFYNPEREQSFSTRPGQTDLSTFAHLIQPRLNDCPGIHIPSKFVPSQPSTFRETMLKMVGFWQQHDRISQLEAQHAATELILSLLKEQRTLVPTASQEPQSLNWITSYLSFHLADPITIAEMARRANLSPSRFSTLFRQRFGISPHQYLLRLRIQHAQDLLQNSQLTLRQIADYCGFADIHHFAKAFKRATNCTPASLRPTRKASHQR